jgi:hypothetical protein
MSGDSYRQQIEALEERHRPRLRTVLPYLTRTWRTGLAKAANAAEVHADELDRLDPPSEVAADHRKYVDALRTVAHDARELAEQKRWRSGHRVGKDLRALPSFQRMVEARQRLLERLSED